MEANAIMAHPYSVRPAASMACGWATVHGSTCTDESESDFESLSFAIDQIIMGEVRHNRDDMNYACLVTTNVPLLPSKGGGGQII